MDNCYYRGIAPISILYLSNNISIKEFFRAKYYLLAGSALLLCSLAIPYALVSLEFALGHPDDGSF